MLNARDNRNLICSANPFRRVPPAGVDASTVYSNVFLRWQRDMARAHGNEVEWWSRRQF